MISRTELRAIRDVVEEARVILNTTQLPHGRPQEAKELLESAVRQADAMLARPRFATAVRKGQVRVSVRVSA
jgi:hypothetical protein